MTFKKCSRSIEYPAFLVAVFKLSSKVKVEINYVKVIWGSQMLLSRSLWMPVSKKIMPRIKKQVIKHIISEYWCKAGSEKNTLYWWLIYFAVYMMLTTLTDKNHVDCLLNLCQNVVK